MLNAFEIIKEIENSLGNHVTPEKLWNLGYIKGKDFHEEGNGRDISWSYKVSNFSKLKPYYKNFLKLVNEDGKRKWKYIDEGNINYFTSWTMIDFSESMVDYNKNIYKTRSLCSLEVSSLERYELIPTITAWKCWTNSDMGKIYWYEKDGLILYTPESSYHIEHPVEICKKVDVLESGFDTINHDGATFSRVQFTRLDDSTFVIRNV